MTDILNWDDEGIKPSAALIQEGYKGGDIPQAENFNYIFNNFSACIKENREEIQKNTEGIPIPDEVENLSQIIEPGIYIGNNLATEDSQTKKYPDAPIYEYAIPPGDNTSIMILKEFTIGNFILEVSKTPANKIYQSFSFYDNSDKRITFERFQTSGGFGDWKNITPRTNRLIWSGCMYMQNDEESSIQTIEFDEPWKLPENQDKGIVLVWSSYDSEAEWSQAHLTYKFIPKEFFVDPSEDRNPSVGNYNYKGQGSAFLLASYGRFGLKYLYLTRERIIGDEQNNKDNTFGNFTYYNRYFVLRYVIGV